MVFCNYCGNSFTLGQRYCSQCGNEIVPSTEAFHPIETVSDRTGTGRAVALEPSKPSVPWQGTTRPLDSSSRSRKDQSDSLISAKRSTKSKLRVVAIALSVFVAISLCVALGISRYSKEQVTTALNNPALLPDTKPLSKNQAWNAISEYTHDTLNAENALGSQDQKTATVLPGGTLALAYVEGQLFGDGPGGDLLIYGPQGDKASYTLFVRDDSNGNWIHVDVNRKGFPNGAAYHDMGHHGVNQARQIMIRNDAPTNLYIDAIIAVYKDQPGTANNHHH